MIVPPVLATCSHLLDQGAGNEYSKDTQHCDSLIPETTRSKAAQPCSYIYPIYSVVKYRLSDSWLLATSPGARLRTCARFRIRRQGGCSTSSRLALEVPKFLMRDGGAERDRTVDPLLAKQVLSQLSYSPIAMSITMREKRWWAWVDSNYRPHPYQGCALTN